MATRPTYWYTMAFIVTSDAPKRSGSSAIQSALTFAGLGCWLGAAYHASDAVVAPTGPQPFTNEGLTGVDLSLFVIPAMVLMVGAFPVHLPLRTRHPALARATSTVSLADLIVLVTACCVGAAPAVLIAGVDGFVASWRARRDLLTSLSALASLSLAAGAAALFVGAGPLTGNAYGGPHATAPAAVVLLLNVLAGLVYFLVNTTTAALPFAPRMRRAFKGFFEAEVTWSASLYVGLGLVAGVMHLLIGYHLLLALAFAAPFVYAFHRAFEQLRVEREEGRAAVGEAHEQIIQALAVAVDAKDEVTHDHVLRVEVYAVALGRMLGCSPAEIAALRAGSLLHDIGKVAIPDHILNKPGKLTPHEFGVMKNHTLIGHTILECVSFPYPVAPVVRHHHEHWDGRGYPDGLKGEEIPLAARILSVVDCFDALREDRPYRRALSREEAVAALRACSGTTYDPRIVETFVAHLDYFEEEVRRHTELERAGGTRYTNTVARAASARLSELLRAPGESMEQATPAAGLALVTQRPADADESAGELLAGFSEALTREETPSGRLDLLTRFLVRFTRGRLCAIVLPSRPPGSFRHHTDTDYLVARASSVAPAIAAALLNRRVEPATEGVVAWTIRTGQPITGTDPSLEPLTNEAAVFEAGCLLCTVPIMGPEDAILGAAVILVGPDRQADFVSPDYFAQISRALSMFAEHYLKDNVRAA